MDQLKNSFKIAQIIARNLTGDEDAALKKELENWIGQSADRKSLVEQITDQKSLRTELSELEQMDTESALLNVKKRIQEAGTTLAVKNTPYLWYRIAAAAAILCIVGFSFLYYSARHAPVQISDFTKQDIEPGGNKAYLILASGKRLSLNDAVNGQLAKEAGVEITKTADGQLVYKIQEAVSTTLLSNTIETPKGGQYQVLLPDGSHVWLNSASKLIYPVSFSKKSVREVQLSGEAYFEITKDKAHPFIVKSLGQEVEVLGTHFNINSYQDEPGVKTTLLEGSVKIQQRSGRMVVLKPGQQALGSSEGINVTTADVETSVAWKNGDFVFKQESLGSLMRQISRWYNVEVSYADESSKAVVLSGYISRSSNISAVLDSIQSTGKVKFRLEGRNILILPQT